ncbi:MAG: glycosyltransferase family 2 protein, partial [Patescibacteria group bacterium]|nr:glycosyltransferase family 2 protein [Patescibacteria group bacterium]
GIREIKGIREDMKLSAIILTKDGNDLKFKKAVESVSFADEVLVVKEKFPVTDFSEVRNRALESAKGEWVLFVDSDEVVTKELGDEILQASGMTGYKLRRRDRFLGKWLKYGETANIRLLRLAKKNAGRWTRPVHEVWKVEGITGELKNPLLHYAHDSVEGMVEKLDRYSGMETEYKLKMVKMAGMAKWLIIFQLIFFPIGKFIQNYILRLGFLDGMEGFIHAGMMSGHSFLVRGKQLSFLRKQESI